MSADSAMQVGIAAARPASRRTTLGVPGAASESAMTTDSETIAPTMSTSPWVKLMSCNIP